MFKLDNKTAINDIKQQTLNLLKTVSETFQNSQLVVKSPEEIWLPIVKSTK